MRQFNVLVADECVTDLIIGKAGEGGVTNISFDLTEWFELFGDTGTLTLLVQRPTDTAPYPVMLDVNGNIARWTVSATDCEHKGIGEAELRYSVEGNVVKSRNFSIKILRALGENAPLPSPWESWLEQILAAADTALEYAQAANESAIIAEDSASEAEDSANKAQIASLRYPYIRATDNHWMVWDVETEEYVDTGVNAGGGGGGGTSDHSQLTNRSAANQHPISAITGLQTALDGKQPSGNYALESDIPTALSQLSADSTHRLVTDTEKSAWDAKGTYSKPSGGIPKTDLASAVQTSLDRADTALQSIPDTYATKVYVDGHHDSAKQDKNIGTAFAGQFLVVGSDGNITTQSLDVYEGGSY